MSNPWQQVFESHREQIEESYVAEKYGQHKSDEAEETQALYDLRNKMKNMGKDAVVAYLKRSKMSPERKARLAKSLGISIAENFEVNDIQEVAPSGAKYERMVKHIKKGYSEGGLTKKEKSIAYATAWKAKNKANEEVEYIEEEAKILVRVTKEDGSVFQKKIPQSQLDDYRKRYKTVVVVGASEQSRTGTNTKNEEFVNEAEKKKPARWWDDDGDGKGWESGEVSGKFKKKKTRKEEYSDWRSEFPELAEATKAQKSVEGKGHASYENQEGDKKKRKKKSSESKCGCSHEMKESAEILAQELGGELVDISENIAKVGLSILKSATKVKPAQLRIGKEPAGALAARVAKPPKSPVASKPETSLTPLEKAELERLRSSSIKDRTDDSLSLSTGRVVKIDNKTGVIVSVAHPTPSTLTKTKTKPKLKAPVPTPSALTKTKTKPKLKAPVPPPPTKTGGPGGKLPGGVPGRAPGNLPIPMPAFGGKLPDPVPQAQQFKV
jgi:hypothetical protein